MKISSTLRVTATAPVAPALKPDADGPPPPDKLDAHDKQKDKECFEKHHEQHLPIVRITAKIIQPKLISAAKPDVKTAYEIFPQLSAQTDELSSATKSPTLSQKASNKLALLAQALVASCQKNTLPLTQASNSNNPSALAIQSLRDFIADPVEIPVGAVGLEQVKSLLMSTTLPKKLSQTTSSERSQRVLLPLQLLIATLPRGQLQQGKALAKLDFLATTKSRDSP